MRKDLWCYASEEELEASDLHKIKYEVSCTADVSVHQQKQWLLSGTGRQWLMSRTGKRQLMSGSGRQWLMSGTGGPTMLEPLHFKGRGKILCLCCATHIYCGHFQSHCRMEI